jgi:hypothetical protein
MSTTAVRMAMDLHGGIESVPDASFQPGKYPDSRGRTPDPPEKP